jgi:cytidine deaminase
MCAEATAIGSAVAAGVRNIDMVAVATLQGGRHFPCGNCSQLMQEFGVERVLVLASDGFAEAHALGELLPHLFGPADLSDTGEGP